MFTCFIWLRFKMWEMSETTESFKGSSFTLALCSFNLVLNCLLVCPTLLLFVTIQPSHYTLNVVKDVVKVYWPVSAFLRSNDEFGSILSFNSPLTVVWYYLIHITTSTLVSISYIMYIFSFSLCVYLLMKTLWAEMYLFYWICLHFI